MDEKQKKTSSPRAEERQGQGGAGSPVAAPRDPDGVASSRKGQDPGAMEKGKAGDAHRDIARNETSAPRVEGGTVGDSIRNVLGDERSGGDITGHSRKDKVPQ